MTKEEALAELAKRRELGQQVRAAFERAKAGEPGVEVVAEEVDLEAGVGLKIRKVDDETAETYAVFPTTDEYGAPSLEWEPVPWEEAFRMVDSSLDQLAFHEMLLGLVPEGAEV